MKHLIQVRFFLVAAVMMGLTSLAIAASPAPEDEKARDQESRSAESSYDWGGDPNSEIGVPGTSVVDTALDKPVPVNCHDCEVANQYAGSRVRSFEPHGDLEKKGGSSSGPADQ